MSTKTFNGAADLPATGINGRGLFATIALVWSAVSDGREAEGCYRHLTVHGVAPGEAAAETFRRHYKS